MLFIMLIACQGSHGIKVTYLYDRNPGGECTSQSWRIHNPGKHCVIRLPKTQPHRRKPPWAWSRVKKLFGRQAIVQPLSTYQRWLKRARNKLAETHDPDAAQRTLDGHRRL